MLFHFFPFLFFFGLKINNNFSLRNLFWLRFGFVAPIVLAILPLQLVSTIISFPMFNFVLVWLFADVLLILKLYLVWKFFYLKTDIDATSLLSSRPSPIPQLLFCESSFRCSNLLYFRNAYINFFSLYRIIRSDTTFVYVINSRITWNRPRCWSLVYYYGTSFVRYTRASFYSPFVGGGGALILRQRRSFLHDYPADGNRCLLFVWCKIFRNSWSGSVGILIITCVKKKLFFFVYGIQKYNS